MKFYSENHILKLEEKKKKNFIFLIVELVSTFILVGISLFFVNFYNKIIFKIVDSFVFSIGGIVFLYCLLNNFLPLAKLIDHVDEITYANSEMRKCKIINLSNPKTYSYCIKAVEVKVLESGKEKCYFVFCDNNEIKLTVGKEYQVLIANNFIKEIINETN